MNCQEFDSIINELARSKPMEASQREQALAHSATCELCAVRLANARLLTEGLKALAATTENKSAPSNVENALLAAFRQQSASPVLLKSSNVVSFPIRQTRIPMWALAAAAVLAVAFGIFTVSRWNQIPAISPTKELATVPSPSPKIENKQDNEIKPALAVVASNQKRKTLIFKTTTRLSDQTDDGFSVKSSLGEFTPLIDSPNSRQEIATDFLPLTYDTADQVMESGQVIRVQMPRTALASFGLPVNLERANETVKADLLLADDGSARAIRFIR